MMPDFHVRPATRADCAEILALHRANHLSALADGERGDGFVTLALEPAHLEELADAGTMFVARGAPRELAGYVLCAPWKFYDAWPMFRAQTDRFPLRVGERELRRANSFQYGPVCVAREWRGRGILEAMFAAVKEAMAPRFEIGATFIDARNVRSLEAHTRKLGFQVVDTWRANNNDYLSLAFNLA